MNMRATNRSTVVNPISPLRRRMIDDVTIRNLSPTTYDPTSTRSKPRAGISARRRTNSASKMSAYQVHLASKASAWATLNQIVYALRFLNGVTLGQDEVPERIPYARKPRTLTEVLSQDEVVRFLEAVSMCRIALTTAHATVMRVSEVTFVDVRNIDSGRMVIRIEHGKGGKHRYVMLWAQLLGILRVYSKLTRRKLSPVAIRTRLSTSRFCTPPADRHTPLALPSHAYTSTGRRFLG